MASMGYVQASCFRERRMKKKPIQIMTHFKKSFKHFPTEGYWQLVLFMLFHSDTRNVVYNIKNALKNTSS